MRKIDFNEMQRAFRNKEVILAGGAIKNYSYATIKDDDDKGTVRFYNQEDEEIYSSWGKISTVSPINQFEIGSYQRDGLSVEFFSKMTISNRNIILQFRVTVDGVERIHNSSIEETRYIQNQIDTMFDGNLDDASEVNNFIAKTYFNMIV
jgi:hypothetical protein